MFYLIKNIPLHQQKILLTISEKQKYSSRMQTEECVSDILIMALKLFIKDDKKWLFNTTMTDVKILLVNISMQCACNVHIIQFL